MLNIENKNTFLASLKTGISFYLGAGFSVYANDHAPKPLPIGSKLQEELVSEFQMQDYQSLELPQLISILEATRRAELDAYLRKRFTVETFDERYRVIRRLRLKSIFTVNIDNLLQRIFEHGSPFYLHDITTHGPANSDEAISYIPLHGCVVNAGQQLTFSAIDIASSSSFDPDRWRYLTTVLQRDPIVFWGTKLVDAGVLTALNSRAINGRSHQPKWIVLRDHNPAIEAYFRALGFSIIQAETAELLDFLVANVSSRDPGLSVFQKRDIASLFPKNHIPGPFSVPVRPSIEFYAGAEPIWHDIFTGKIPKTRHFDRVLDLVNSKCNGAVIGIPFSGKTTLMMQIAHELATDKYKLLFDSITPEQAESIVARLADDPAIIFLDNFSDSLDGYLQLMRESHIQVIGFDRDVNYEVVSHFIDKESIKVVDVTELNDSDLQTIFDKLPTESRVDQLHRPTVATGTAPSLFEFVEGNLKRPSLRTRIPSMLKNLRKMDEKLFDWLLMFSYVTECRTVVSLDMLWAYLNGTPTYHSIRDQVKHLGAMVAEVDTLDLGLDCDQDYFQIRSRILSSLVLDNVSGQDLREMMIRFHSQISPYRIVKFDVFRKSAYQSRLTTRAFGNADEGKRFYEDVYNRQPNPYVLQQGAMYLSGKGRFTEAFRWIDQAIGDTSGKIHSIRNTYAMILFRANINASGDEDSIRSTLIDSMKILGELYHQDERKNYHVGTFAKQAIEFWERYRDAKSFAYLRDAKDWLDREIAKSPWNNILKYSLNRVNTVLIREQPRS